MSSSTEARSIVLAAASLRQEGTPFLVATVVRVSGSSYRRPGARLLATSERRIAGSVSGGCLERDVIRTGFWRTRSGPVVVRYDSSDPEEEETGTASLGCGGIVDVLLERGLGSHNDNDNNTHDAHHHGPIACVAEGIASDRPTSMATVFRSTIAEVPVGTRWCVSTAADDRVSSTPSSISARVLSDCRQTLSIGGAARPYRYESESGVGEIEALVEAILPAPHLFVFGAGLDAIPVVENARRLGWNVTVWDPTARFETHNRFFNLAELVAGDLGAIRDRIDNVNVCDRSFAIVMSHHRDHDKRAITMLLESRASYIGVLGPRHRTESIVGARALDDPRVHAPVGLDLGAETSEEIALSITAEMLACSRRDATAKELKTLALIHRSTSST